MTASVALALDTRPPVVTITAPERVEPPDRLEVTVVADEPIGIASVALVDALGKVVNLGYERVSDRALLVQVPSLGLAAGPATIRVSLADSVLNFTQSTASVLVFRPRAYDVELTLTRAYDLDATLDGAYEVILDVDRSHLVTLEVS